MKSVVVVGAGPAGLVAAKTLLHSTPPGTFKVTILEKAGRVGGLWPLEKGDQTSMLRPDMRTNLSKYTVAFSDLAWSSVSIRATHQHTNGARDYGTSSASMFPKAWHVGQYLQAYADKYITRESIRFNSEVTSAEWVREGDQYAWLVKWTSLQGDRSASEGQSGKGMFDYMIIATGFFAEPRRLSNTLPATTSKENTQPRVVHSTQLRSLSDLFPDGLLRSDAESNVVVVGGAMSGAEAAAHMAMQLSSAQHSPKSNKSHEGIKIYHVIARPFYAMPLFLPSTGAHPSVAIGSGARFGPTFLPLDLVFYELGRRMGAITPAWGKVQPDKAGSTHRFLQSLIGSDQSDLGSQALAHHEEQRRQPPYVAISEGYAEFVRSGAITPVYGRMTAVNTNQVVVTAEGEARRICNVAAIVNATGFSPHISISWLPKDVLDILEYDEASMRLPLLYDNSISHPMIPNLGFVGFYEGPYWGVMEMQARTLAKTWAQPGHQDQSEPNPGTTASNEKAKTMRQLREEIRKGEGIPQFWMGDYIGLMEGFAADLGIVRNDALFGGRCGPVVPARYTVDRDDKQEADIMLKDLKETLRATTFEGLFVARAAFRAMQGSWKMRRTLTSVLPNFPSGTFKGVANLHPRYPTDVAFDAEYLYIEDGELLTEQGFTLKASRRYVYRYREDTDKISAWFVKDDGKTVDYFFNEMNFQVPKDSADQRVGREGAAERTERCVAKGSHLCVDDMYESSCNFEFQGIALKKFGIKYMVNGPRKNYISDTWYER